MVVLWQSIEDAENVNYADVQRTWAPEGWLVRATPAAYGLHDETTFDRELIVRPALTYVPDRKHAWERAAWDEFVAERCASTLAGK